MKIAPNVFIPTQDIMKMAYITECLIMTEKPVALMGGGACGKGSFMREFLFAQVYTFAKDIHVDHVTCSHHTNSY